MNKLTRQLKPFQKNLLKHFNISDFEKVYCPLLSFIRMKPTIDYIKFDDLLHKRHGNYEDDDLSMSDVILKYYGADAHRWFVKKL
jgi:hypothetical protein